MREFTRLFAAGVMAAVWFSSLGGCATFPPPKEAIPNSRAYANDYETVWKAVLASLSDWNIATTSVKRGAGTIAAEDGSIELRPYELGKYDSKYCFCGPPERGTVFRKLVGTYEISLTKRGDHQTSVEIDAAYRASMYAGDALTGWLPCPSKGIFEPLFLDQVESRLPARTRPTPSPAPAPKGSDPFQNIDHWWKPTWV
ncbi:MAG: hypothetical protein WBX50_04625, partial [Candidatus Deferrimicrobiaceae bacterium]